MNPKHEPLLPRGVTGRSSLRAGGEAERGAKGQPGGLTTSTVAQNHPSNVATPANNKGHEYSDVRDDAKEADVDAEDQDSTEMVMMMVVVVMMVRCGRTPWAHIATL